MENNSRVILRLSLFRSTYLTKFKMKVEGFQIYGILKYLRYAVYFNNAVRNIV